jgi:hypothetical protein
MNMQVDGNYIIIKQWISEDFQEELFQHTRRLREENLITEQLNASTKQRRVNDKRGAGLYVVRKSPLSPSRRAWIFS